MDMGEGGTESYSSLEDYLITTPDIVEFSKYLFDWHPFDYQEKAMRDESKRLLMNFGRQSGKSDICSIKGLFKALTEENTTVLIVSPTQRQSSLLFRKIKYKLNKMSQLHPNFCRKNMYGKTMLDCIVRETQTVIEFSNGSEIHSLPAGDEGDTLRGFTAHMIIIDEAAMVKNEVYVALQPMFATTFQVGQLILISTPRGIQNYFYEAYNNKGLGFKVYKAKSKQSPLITKEFLKTQSAQMTNNEYLQEYEGAFLDETDTFFPLHEIESVMTSEASWKEEHDKRFEYYFGYDPATVGEDEAVGIILERRPEHMVKAGAREFAVANIITKKKCGIAEQIGMIKHLHTKWNFKKLCIDVTGLGVSFPEELHGLPVEGFLFNQKTVEDLYNSGKKFFEARTLIMPNHMKMKKQLNEMKFEYNKHTGRLSVFNPRKHAKTDHPTALMLALWATKKKIHEILFDSGKALMR
jgi:phage FluMu gp28-like protein